MLLGNAQRPDVAVDGRSTHRDRHHIAHDIAVVDRNVGYAGAHVHYGDTLLLFVGQQYRLRGGQRIGNDAERPDTEAFERHFEALHGGPLAEDEVERRGELLAERPDGIAHLPVVIDRIVLGHALHDRLVVGSLNVAHAVEQRIDILLIDPVLRVVDEDMVRMAGTAHEIARNARIGLRDVDAELFLDLPEGFAHGLAHQFDILDLAGTDPFDGFRHHAGDLHQPAVRLLADSHADRRRTQIDGYDIILSFHGIISISCKPPDSCTGRRSCGRHPTRSPKGRSDKTAGACRTWPPHRPDGRRES